MQINYKYLPQSINNHLLLLYFLLLAAAYQYALMQNGCRWCILLLVFYAVNKLPQGAIRQGCYTYSCFRCMCNVQLIFFLFLNFINPSASNNANFTYMQLVAWHCANVPHQIHFLPHTNTCPRHFHDVNVSPASRVDK